MSKNAVLDVNHKTCTHKVWAEVSEFHESSDEVRGL